MLTFEGLATLKEADCILVSHPATGAILDRLIRRGYAVTIEGPSYHAAEHKKLNSTDKVGN